ncbi:MAG: signal peptidase I [Oscillospiraceae bacterium]|nr:signal peptidase I [Oscillospiraceae bacterium]
MTENPRPAETEDSTVTLLKQELTRVESGMRFSRILRSTAFALVIVAAIAVLLATLLFPVLQIYGGSMSPTLCEGEVVVAVKTGNIRSGELVAFYYGNKVLVKRCIGAAGDIIHIDAAGNVSVNGAPLDEPYLEERSLGTCDIELPYQVPDGRYFVMGDQRKTSIDSRNTLVGCIASEQIVGTIAFRIWPLSRFGAVR